MLGIRAQNWIRPNLKDMETASILAEVHRTSTLARESHWCIGWAYALRHEALSNQSQ